MILMLDIKIIDHSALRSLQLKLPDITSSSQKHYVYCQDSLSLIEDMPIEAIVMKELFRMREFCGF